MSVLTTEIGIVTGLLGIETAESVMDAFCPQILQDDPYFVQSLLSWAPLALVSYETGLLINYTFTFAADPFIATALGFGASFFLSAAVAMIVLPAIRDYRASAASLPDPSILLQDVLEEGAVATWDDTPHQEWSKSLMLTQCIVSVALTCISGNPLFFIAAGLQWINFDMNAVRRDLRISWHVEPVGGALDSCDISYYYPIYTEIPALLQWMGRAQNNSTCPISGEKLDAKGDQHISYTFGGSAIDTVSLICLLEKQRREMMESLEYSIQHTMHYTNGVHTSDSFTANLYIPQSVQPGAPGEAVNLGHLTFEGRGTFLGGTTYPVALDSIKWTAEPKKNQLEEIA